MSQLHVFFYTLKGFFLQFYSHYQDVPCCVDVNEMIKISRCRLSSFIPTSRQSSLCGFTRVHSVLQI